MGYRLRGTPREVRTRDRPMSVAFRNNAARKQYYRNQSTIHRLVASVVERRESMKDYIIIQKAQKELQQASAEISKKYDFDIEDMLVMNMDFCAKTIAILSQFFTDKVIDKHAEIDEIIDKVREDVHEYMEEYSKED